MSPQSNICGKNDGRSQDPETKRIVWILAQEDWEIKLKLIGTDQRDPESQPPLLTGHPLFQFGFGCFIFYIHEPCITQVQGKVSGWHS